MESVVSMRSNEAEEFPCTSERGLYDDVVQETDRIIGQIPEKPEQLNLPENTLAIFSSDNGH